MPPLTASSSPPWPLVGRDVELARIAAARAQRGCPGVVVGAPAGVGKSRLARVACDMAQSEGATVVWVQATSSAATVPLGAFADLLLEDVRTDDTLELMRRSIDSLRRHADGRPVVLGVDDGQLLDPVSAALVLHLTATETAFVVVTVRSGEPCPDAIVSLWKDASAQRLELGPLSDDAVGALVEAVLGGPVEQSVLRWVCETSEGNALYVRELVVGALDAGVLTQTHGLWHMDGPPAMSATLAELVTARMAGLTDAERTPLELLALGEPLRLDELVALADYESLVSAEARGLVLVGPPSSGSSVRLAHPLYGDVVRGELPRLRRRQLLIDLAETIARREPRLPDDAIRIARWLLDADATLPTALLVEAARAANQADAPELGARLAELAVDAGAGAESALILARAYTLRKRFADAERVLAAIEGALETQDQAVEYLEQRVSAVLYYGLKRPTEARALLERAQSWWPGDDWRRRLEPTCLALQSMDDGLRDSVDDFERILADPQLGTAARRQLEPMHALALFFAGRGKEAYALARRIRPPIPLRDQSDMLALFTWELISCHTGEDWTELDAYMRQAMRDALRAGDQEAAGHAALTLGYVHSVAGRFRDATRRLAEAELHFERQDAFGSIVVVLAHRATVANTIGDRATAAASLDRLNSELDGRDPLPTQMSTAMRARAWAVHASGDPERAQQMLLDAARDVSDVPTYATLLAYEAMRAGAPAATIVAELTGYADRCDSRMAAAHAAHVRAAAARDGDGLMAASDEFAAIGTLRYAMEAAAHAATAFLAAGHEDRARRALVRARELHVPGESADPPVVDGLDSDATSLTTREAQIVELVRRGMTNAEIADALVLSVRTVETHVYHATQKLGVSDRREL
jgi:DNA-binding CsgD family transcriptional regulator